MNSKRLLWPLTLLLILAVYLPSFNYFERWNVNIISGGDSWGYYAYLPALFIHHDLDSLHRSVPVRKSYHQGFYSSATNPIGIDEALHIGGGKQVIKYTMGIAILNLPAFALGHGLALALDDYPADGYSPPYVLAIHLYVFLVLFLGLFILKKVLQRYVRDPVMLVTLLTLTLATNLFFFTVYNGPMAHAYLFTLHSLLLWATIRWYESRRWGDAILVGLSAGFITLIRPTDGIILLLPLLYGVTGWRSLRERFAFIGRHWRAYLPAVLVFIACGIPQLIYWKWVTGDFFYYSYGDEGFDFANPRIRDGLLSYKNGWLAYTPVMGLALLGLYFLRRHRELLLPTLIILPLHIYIIYSWWCWNYIAGFGSRPMIDLYPLLSIPLALMLQFLFRRVWTLLPTAALLLFFAFLNIFNTCQLYWGILWSEDANTAYYWRMFGETEADYLDLMVLDSREWVPDTATLEPVKTLLETDFETPADSNFVQDPVYSGQYAYRVPRDNSGAAQLQATAEALGAQPGDWVKFGVQAWKEHHHSNPYDMNWLVVSVHRDGKVEKWSGVRIDNKMGNPTYVLFGGRARTWGPVLHYAQLPNDLRPDDLITAHVWKPTGNTIVVDELRIELLSSEF